jgi:DNA-binding CsgD family transcriptional regulator/PAS domain-containing protein
MISTVELSDLLADLYAAPLEPEKWQAFFDRLCRLTSIASGFMISVRPEGNVILAGGGLNFDPEISHLYNQHYGAKDPYTEPAMRNHRIGLMRGDELVSRADLVKSELYNEVLIPYGLGHMTLMSCECSAEAVSKFPLWSSPKHGPMDAASTHLLETLIPHVQTALLLRSKIAASDASNLFSETALDAMSIAAFLVTGKGQIRHMNRLAAGYLEGTEGLRSHDGRLTATDSYEDAQLQLLIAGASGEKDASVSLPGGAMKIVRPLARTTLQVTVVPAPERYRPAESGSCALVFVSDPSSQPRPRAALMRALYGLTPAEARLADLLLEGCEVREAADRLRTTLETARFHLKRVLAKTGTRRQTELMRLMLSLPGVVSETRSRQSSAGRRRK